MKPARYCLIGSGVAAATVAERLLDGGAEDVLMLEAGDKPVMRSSRAWQDYVMQRSWPFAPYAYRELDYENRGSTKIFVEHIRLRGGSAMHWDGMSYRLMPEDFRLRSNTGEGADWPIAYDELEPFYGRAEHTLQVAGHHADPGHPPRTTPFPMAAFPASAAERAFIEATTRLGISTQHACIARNSSPVHGMPACQKTGTCLYCPLGARFTTDQLLDRLEPRKGFRLQTRKAVVRINLSSAHTVASVTLVDGETGSTSDVEADQFILCAGAMESCKLLLTSTNAWWPAGVGNHSDHVGRYLTTHAFESCKGHKSGNPEHLFDNTDYETTISRAFDNRGTQGKAKFLMAPKLEQPGADMAAGQLSRGESIASVRRLIEDALVYSVWYQLEQHPLATNRIVLAKGTDTLGMKRFGIEYQFGDQVMRSSKIAKDKCAEILQEMGCSNLEFSGLAVSSHYSGTCRMAATEHDGVVDANLKVFGVDNLFVCGSSVFPSIGAANPTLTIVALAHRLGEHLSRA
jgi:choline dehydrogenase-like flavoprotein